MRLRLSIVCALCAAVLVSAGPALADTPPVYYVALGDSLATGFQPVSKKGKDTNEGYVYVLHESKRATMPNLHLANFGCGGETTTTLIVGGSCKYKEGSQLAAAVAFLDSHAGEIAFVTLDIGGNDFRSCHDVLDFTLACVDSIAPTVSANLATILSRLREAAGPEVAIAGMNYYNPFAGLWVLLPDGQGVARDSSDYAVAINDVLEAGYRDAGSPVADVETAFAVTDFTTMVALPGVGELPLSVYNACTLTWVCQFGDGHPNAAGYALIAHAFEAALP